MNYNILDYDKTIYARSSALYKYTHEECDGKINERKKKSKDFCIYEYDEGN